VSLLLVTLESVDVYTKTQLVLTVIG
jgi:hypothetical protein